jgi:high-affinity nickel permease
VAEVARAHGDERADGFLGALGHGAVVVLHQVFAHEFVDHALEFELDALHGVGGLMGLEW